MSESLVVLATLITEQLTRDLPQQLESQLIVRFEILMNFANADLEVVKRELVLIGTADDALHKLV